MRRLVTSSRTAPVASSRSDRSFAALASCSMLSSTISIRAAASRSRSRSATLAPGCSSMPSDFAMVGSTREGSVSGARSMCTMPSGYRSLAPSATASASRDLPIPPGPTIVTIRTPGSSSRSNTRVRSWSRPMSRVTGRGSGGIGAGRGGSAGAFAETSKRSVSNTAKSSATSARSSSAVPNGR
jgi:hypothetical protein